MSELDPIEAGDTVARGPHGMCMVVVRTDRDFVTCCWVDEHGRPRQSVFIADELRRVE